MVSSFSNHDRTSQLVLILCDFKDNPQVSAQVGKIPTAISILSLTALLWALACCIFTASEFYKYAGFPGFAAVVCTVVNIVMESTLKKRARAGFIINFVVLLFIGVYTLYLAKVTHQACRTGSEDAQAGNELELEAVRGSVQGRDQTGSSGSGQNYRTFT